MHSRGKKIYITLNAVFHPRDFDGLDDYIAMLSDAGVDAFIVTDPGVLRAVRQAAPKVSAHQHSQHEQCTERAFLA